jgi:hypothetical protein
MSQALSPGSSLSLASLFSRGLGAAAIFQSRPTSCSLYSAFPSSIETSVSFRSGHQQNLRDLRTTLVLLRPRLTKSHLFLWALRCILLFICSVYCQLLSSFCMGARDLLRASGTRSLSCSVYSVHCDDFWAQRFGCAFVPRPFRRAAFQHGRPGNVISGPEALSRNIGWMLCARQHVQTNHGSSAKPSHNFKVLECGGNAPNPVRNRSECFVSVSRHRPGIFVLASSGLGPI